MFIVFLWQKKSSPSPVAKPIIPSVTKLSPSNDFSPPLDRAGDRVTKKKFGQLVSDRFSGYHTGVDFETFPDEQNTAISISAVCTGKLHLKESASGYGGVVVQDCQVDNQPITVVYGHVKLTSVTKNIGDTISIGETLGMLGAPYSTETDGERKHLHLGFHKGTEINIRGYVDSQTQLDNWLNPCQFVCLQNHL